MSWWNALIRWLGLLPDEPAEPVLPNPTDKDSTPDLPTQDEPTMEPDVPYEPTILDKPLPNFYTGWTRKPWAIVVHYSAGYTAQSCHETLERRGLSVHATIERDGTIWREVSDDNRGIHAGYGRWAGQSNMNHHAFGFEIANMGPMDGPFTGTSPYFVYDPQKYGVTEINPMADGTIQYRDESYTDSSGKKKTNCVLTRTKCASFPDHRQEYAKKVWSIFPDEQLQAVFWFMYQWVLKHDILPENIIGHEHVTPGRKQDPGPAFPWTAWEDWLAEQLAEDRPELLDPTHRQSERIKAVQSHCARMGLAVGDIDGIWGPRTEASVLDALQLFRSTYKLGGVEVRSDNCLEIANALRRVPGFDPDRR
jgi:N-acetyl-anhydromuramyl-L-alanine amidase AmpD